MPSWAQARLRISLSGLLRAGRRRLRRRLPRRTHHHAIRRCTGPMGIVIACPRAGLADATGETYSGEKNDRD